MLHITTGLPGNGKTLFTIWHVKKYLEKENKIAEKNNSENREVYYHGIKGLSLGWNQLDDPKEWWDLPTGSIIIIDEAQHTFPNMPSGSARPDYYMKMTEHRHKGFDIFLITQNASNIDFKVRSMCNRHFHLARKHGMPMATLYEFPTVQDTSKDWYKKAEDLQKKQWKFPKEVYNYYESAEVHTHRANIPYVKLGGIAVLTVITASLFYKGITSFSTRSYEDEQIAEQLSQPTTENITRVSNPQFQIQDLKPTIEAIPASAPIYKNLFAIQDAPRIDGCSLYQFNDESICKCNDQRGNLLSIDEQTCVSYITNGFFDFTQSTSDYRRENGAGGRPATVAPSSTGSIFTGQ